MNASEIDVYIEELVLYCFAPEMRWQIGDALETKLRGLLAEKGVPDSWLSNPERMDAGTIRATGLTKPITAGAQIAGAIYQGGAQ